MNAHKEVLQDRSGVAATKHGHHRGSAVADTASPKPILVTWSLHVPILL